MKTLKDTRVGETVRVVKLHGEGAIKRRIMDMGITKGVEIYIRKVAPFGDPVECTVTGLRAVRPQGGGRDDRGGMTPEQRAAPPAKRGKRKRRGVPLTLTF